MRLSDNRYEAIKQIVVRLFEDYNVCSTPISGSGYDNGGWRIAYNDDQSRPYGRVNFTILHELGHIVLNHTEDSDYADKGADFFAKFAQCPPVLIHKLGIRDVGGIMNHFDISYGAACNALDYYNKWLRFGGNYYKDYEIRTCELFGFAV